MKLILDQIPSYLSKLNLTLFSGNIKIGEMSAYNVREHWFNIEIPNAGKNGIYIYASFEKEILYIGKAEYSSSGGIGYRSCAHLGSAQKDSDRMFPYHQWANADIDQHIKDIIEKGEFHIWTLPISPPYFISLIETFLQTLYFDLHEKHPPLNKKIG
jgi:hypothetical protein